MIHRLGYLLLTLLFVWSCSSSPLDNYKPMNLIQYGVPITIMAPDSCEVEKTKLSFQDDITITKDKNFAIQLFVSEAFTSNIDEVLKGQKNEVQANPFFSKFLKEDPKGFVYEMKIDSNTTTYGFRHIDLMGDKEYIFREAMVGTFTQEAAETMYMSVTSGH